MRFGYAIRAAGSVLTMLSVLVLLALILAAGVTLLTRPNAAASIGKWVPVVAAVLGIGQLLRIVGEESVRQARLRLNLVLHIDQDGIAWTGTSGGTLSWGDMHHVIVTARPRNNRRLQILSSSMSEVGKQHASTAAGVHYVHRLLNPGPMQGMDMADSPVLG
jgi:hypothetical protein